MKDNTHYNICITRAGQERLLLTELNSLNLPLECNELGARVVEISGPRLASFPQFCLYFAAQLLPDAIPLSAPSIKTWATLLSSALIEHLTDTEAPWILHIFDPATAESGKPYSRPKLVYQETLAILKQKRRALLKSLVSGPAPEATLVQVALTSSATGWMSTSAPALRRSLAPTISPFVAGFVDIPDDPTPPSRAFKKLKEAIQVFELPVRRGASCVDLGACPGGWTHVLLEYGCRITAVDRSPLDPRLMKSRNVSFERGDAFRWTPPTQVDLMVCDVIAAPTKTVDLIERWLRDGLCRALCCTIKFKGTPDFNALHRVRSLLSTYCKAYGGKQLTNNKNELTVFGLLRD
jgi:23S rRNA (cytidine2498-2'-O)-methyltransferase